MAAWRPLAGSGKADSRISDCGNGRRSRAAIGTDPPQHETSWYIARPSQTFSAFEMPPNRLLDVAYAELGLSAGALHPTADTPFDMSRVEWIDRGEWLAAARAVGAEAIFFVDNNPVLVFASFTDPDPEAIRKYVNRVWCLSRPHRLFLEVGGELRVYDLTKPPERRHDAASSVRSICDCFKDS
jgi:hypothetical protein